jgi:AraC family transcriptional regulator
MSRIPSPAAARPPGQPFGRIVAARRSERVVVTESRYAPDAALPAHHHEAPYFCLVLRGDFVERRGGVELRHHSGDLVFHPAGEVHSDRFGAGGGGCCNVEFRHADRDPDVQRLMGRAGCRAAQPVGTGTLAVRIHRELRHGDSFSALALEALALELLVASAREDGWRNSDDPLTRVRDRLRDGYGEDLRLSALAAEVGLHPAHLARRFRARYSNSIGEYLRRVRVERVIAELSRPDAVMPSLAELALRCGFADQSHLTRVFRRHTGTTPARYRRLRSG